MIADIGSHTYQAGVRVVNPTLTPAQTDVNERTYIDQDKTRHI